MKDIKKLENYLKDIFESGKGKDRKIFKETSSEKIISGFLDCLVDYSKYLESFESKILKRPAYSKVLQKDFDKISNKMLKSAFKLESVLPKKSQKAVRHLFRNCINSYIFQSKLIKRYYDKPRGYPGDFIMFESIYDFKPLSRGIGLYFDNYVLNYSLAQSVVNRKDKMKNYLKSFIKKHKGEAVKIVNIGCGSSREVRELFEENKFSRNIEFTLVDQDQGGLIFSKKKLMKIVNGKVKINPIHKEAVNLMGLGKNKVAFMSSDRDLIYSMGVVDYFLDNVFESFISFHYRSLKPGGKLIVASCSSEKPHIYTLLTWFSEWFFYYRSVKDVEKIFRENIKINKFRFSWEKNREVFFMIIEKE